MEHFRGVITKSSVNKLKLDFVDKKYENVEEVSRSKVIKISSESEDYKVFSNPWMIGLLITFIIFFSNLAVSLYAIFNNTSTYFLNALDAHKFAVDL